jgi:hypothetical protein
MNGGRLPKPGYLRIVSADRISEGLPDLASEEGQAGLIKCIEEHDAELVILDNLSA